MITIVFCGDIFTDSGTYYNEGLVYHIPPIIRAATYADMNVFKKLIHDGVSIDAEDKDGNTSISLVIMNMNYPQNRNMLAYVLRLHPHMRIKSKDGLMPIHFAARIDPSMQNQNVRHVAIAKLIQFGARMDDKDNKGYTILDRTVERYEVQGTQAMLNILGPLMTDQMIENSIRIATERALLDPVDFALKKGRRKIAHMDPIDIDPHIKFNGLHCAVMVGDVRETERLLSQKNASVNKPVADEFAMQPLHLAVLQGNFAMVKLLIQYKADVNGVDADGNTPLHLTANLQDIQAAIAIASYLLQHNAQKDKANKKGNTVLHLFVFYNNWRMIKELRKTYSLDNKIKNNERETPFEMAVRLNRNSLLQ